MKHVVVIAPRSAEEARAAFPALRALKDADALGEVEVIASKEAADALNLLGVSSVPLGDDLSATLRAGSPDAVVLMDSSETHAAAARDAGVSVRVGWGRRLGALTHAVQPGRLRGSDHRPDPARTYLDVVGLLGVLPISETAEFRPDAPEGNILVRLPNWLGDVIQCEPLLRVFRGSSERLHVVGPGAFRPLFTEMLPGATWLSRREGARAWRGNDLALLLDGSIRSAWRAARARIPKRVSWARGGKSFWLTDAVRPPRELGAPAIGNGRHGSTQRWLPRPFDVSVSELASAAGINILGARPLLATLDAGRQEALTLLEGAGVSTGERFVLVAVGGRQGSAKAVPADTWAAIFEAFRRQSDVPVLLTCGPGEGGCIEELMERGVPPGVRPIRGGATGLLALLGLLERASVFVTADSGPRHIAAAINCPSVVLHGPTDPRHSGVSGARIRSSRLQVPCGPCHLERCPLKGSQHMACFGLGHEEPVAAMLCELLAPEAEDMNP